jgi:probable HAF family extracellular repeat protein
MKYQINSIYVSVFVLLIVIYISSCKEYTTAELSVSLELISAVEPIQGAQNATMDLQFDRTNGAPFSVDLSKVGSNSIVGNGTKQAWCIEWDAPVIKDAQNGVRLYSTQGKAQWEDVNYFLSQRESLQEKYPELSWKEVQIIIWSLVKHKPFDIDQIPSYQSFSENYYKDGTYLFNVDLTKTIITNVKATSRKKIPSDNTFAIIIENKGQAVIVESGKTIWAYGEYSFRSQKLRDQIGATGQGKGQWGWIFEMEGEYAITQLIAGGGNDDGSKPADAVGTTVGNLKMLKNQNKLEVTYSMGLGYLINNLHLEIGCSLDEFPWTGTANLPPGQLTYSYQTGLTNTYTFTISLAKYNCSGNLFIAAHAGTLYKGLNPNMEAQELPIFKTAPNEYVDGTYATAINNNGEVVGNQWMGVCLIEGCGQIYFENIGFYWTPQEGLTGKSLPYASEHDGIANPVTDINNKREITSVQYPLGALFIQSPEQGSTVIELGTLSGGVDPVNSTALGINDLSQVVGYAENSSGQQHAFIWDAQNGMTDLGTLPGYTGSRATAINNYGQVIGWHSSSSGKRYFFWDEQNGMTDLGPEPIQSINDYGVVSSSAAINNHGQTISDGFLHDPKLGTIELRSPNGEQDCEMVDINDNSQVVGNCKEREHATLWNVGF